MTDSKEQGGPMDPNGIPKKQKKARGYRPTWDDRSNDSEQNPNSQNSDIDPNEPRRRKGSSYRPEWAGGPKAAAKVDAPAEKDEAPKKVNVVEPPVVTVVMVSTQDQPISSALLANVKSQDFIHTYDMLVIRTEELPAVDSAIKQHKATALSAADGAMVVRSVYDHGASNSKSEFVLYLASNLTPQGDQWLSALIKPMLEDTETIAVRGIITPNERLSPYEAYRFDELEHDPIGFMAIRYSAWEKRSFHHSGNLGHRWLEMVSNQGKIEVATTARAMGILELPDTFSDIVGISFCNTRISLFESLGSTISQTLGDWDAIQSHKLDEPSTSYVRAAQVRLAENIAKTRFRRYFPKK